MVGVLTGRKTLEAIAQFGRDHGPRLAHALGFTRTTPTKSTLSRAPRRLDPEAVEAALARWVRSRLPADADALAIDGKVARGSRDGEVPGHHLRAAYAPHVGAVAGQLRVAATTNGHKAARRLLGVLPVAGRVVTGDARSTHPDVCRAVLDGGGDYVRVVKDNQKALGSTSGPDSRSRTPPFPPDGGRPAAPGSRAATTDEGHGRREHRAIRVTTLPTAGQDWPGLKQGFRVTRRRVVKGVTTEEVAYGITSLPRDRAGAARSRELVRAHWGIENGLHHVRDVTLGRTPAGSGRGQPRRFSPPCGMRPSTC